MATTQLQFGLTQSVAPVERPLTPVDVKDHLRLDGHDEDAHLVRLIEAARARVEDFTLRQLVTATWRLSLDRFYTQIQFPRAPLQSITSITYTDQDGASQTVTASDYQVDTDTEPARVTPAYGVTWPTVRDVYNAVKVTFKAGYGDTAADVPDAIKAAMLLMIGHWYENREQVVTGTIATALPNTVEALLSPYRIAWDWNP